MKNKRLLYLKDKINRFETIGFEPIGRSDLPAYIINLPFDWGVDPFEDNNWRFQLNTLRYLMIYVDAFDESKDIQYLNAVYNYIKDWANYSMNYGNEFAWHDMATGIRAEKLSYLLDVIKKNKCRAPNWLNELVLLHVKKMRLPEFINTNHNHGLYAVHGLRSLAKHLGPGMRKNVLAYTRMIFIKILRSQFDSNFVHKEHSPHYHHLVTETLGRYIKTGLYNDLPLLQKCYEEATKHRSFFYLPDGRELPFGDTDGVIEQSNIKFTEKSNWSFFNLSGYFVAKNSNGTYLALTNTYTNKVHKHCDNLSLIFGYKGRDILLDPGKYKYGNDNIRNMILSSSYHNVLNFKENDWGLADLKMLNQKYTYIVNDAFFTVSGEIKLLGKKVELYWRRKVIFHEKGALIIVDNVNSLLENLVVRFIVNNGVNFSSYSVCENKLVEVKSKFQRKVPVSRNYGAYDLETQLIFDISTYTTVSVIQLDSKFDKQDIQNFIEKSVLIDQNEALND